MRQSQPGSPWFQKTIASAIESIDSPYRIAYEAELEAVPAGFSPTGIQTDAKDRTRKSGKALSELQKALEASGRFSVRVIFQAFPGTAGRSAQTLEVFQGECRGIEVAN